MEATVKAAPARTRKFAAAASALSDGQPDPGTARESRESVRIRFSNWPWRKPTKVGSKHGVRKFWVFRVDRRFSLEFGSNRVIRGRRYLLAGGPRMASENPVHSAPGA